MKKLLFRKAFVRIIDRLIVTGGHAEALMGEGVTSITCPEGKKPAQVLSALKDLESYSTRAPKRRRGVWHLSRTKGVSCSSRLGRGGDTRY